MNYYAFGKGAEIHESRALYTKWFRRRRRLSVRRDMTVRFSGYPFVDYCVLYDRID